MSVHDGEQALAEAVDGVDGQNSPNPSESSLLLGCRPITSLHAWIHYHHHAAHGLDIVAKNIVATNAARLAIHTTTTHLWHASWCWRRHSCIAVVMPSGGSCSWLSPVPLLLLLAWLRLLQAGCSSRARQGRLSSAWMCKHTANDIVKGMLCAVLVNLMPCAREATVLTCL